MWIWEKVKNWWNKMLKINTVREKLKIVPAISNQMEAAISSWYEVYMNKPMKDEDGNELKRLNIGYSIADRKAMMACIEMKATVTEKDADELVEGSRAQFLDKQVQQLLKTFRHDIVPGLALGSLVIKPIPNLEQKRIDFEYVLANEFFPMKFNTAGKMIQALFVEYIVKKDLTYTRLEFHSLKNGTITITNNAFKRDSAGQLTEELGTEIPLTEVAEWSMLKPSIDIKSENGMMLDRLLVAYYKNPIANNVDPHSKLGMSVYAAAMDLIFDAQEQYSSLQWEYKGGEMAINAPRNAIKEYKDEDGNIKGTISKREKRLYREINATAANGSDIFQTHNPTLRDDSYMAGLNRILNMIEDRVGVARGTLAEMDEVARTATEMKQVKQLTFQSNKDIQESLQDTIEDLIYIMNIYADIYKFSTKSEYKAEFTWDDSILVDVAEELRQKNSLVALGAMEAVEVAAWYENITVEQRYQRVQKLRELQQKYDPQPIEDTSVPR